jgi:hypothetical protein
MTEPSRTGGEVSIKWTRVDLSTLANVATALTVLTAVVFGLLEARRAREERKERAALSAVQTLMTPAWMRSAVVVQSIPDGVSAAELEADPRALEAAHSIGIMLEALGYSVFARLVPLDVVDDLIGGVTRVAWRKLRRYIEFERERAGSQKSWEWFQWLAEQLERNGKKRTSLSVGAQVAHRDWKP